MAPTDRDVLLALYNATDGPSWKNSTNWDTYADLSYWYGVEVALGRVVKLNLDNNNLRGIYPTNTAFCARGMAMTFLKIC